MKSLKKMFRKSKYIAELECRIRQLEREIEELNVEISGLNELNKGLTSDLMSYKRKCRNSKKGGMK